MGLTIGEYEFEGPHSSTDNLQDSSGIYVVVDYVNEQYCPIDCGESVTVKSRVKDQDRSDCWRNESAGVFMLFVLYTPKLQSAGRVAIE